MFFLILRIAFLGTVLGFLQSGGEQTIMKRQPAIYILTSSTYGTLYIGVTSNPAKRVWEHKSDPVDGFSKKHQVHLLVYFEIHKSMRTAILREKQIKKWNREWKLKLIERSNPSWRDLYDQLGK
jgi:putative endonuclease